MERVKGRGIKKLTRLAMSRVSYHFTFHELISTSFRCGSLSCGSLSCGSLSCSSCFVSCVNLSCFYRGVNCCLNSGGISCGSCFGVFFVAAASYHSCCEENYE